MLGRTYEGQNCSVAKSLELIGERWTMLVVREVFLGNRRFDEIATRLDIARNVLTTRLARLVDEGVLEKVRYQERPERFEYRLTEKGIDLWPIMVSPDPVRRPLLRARGPADDPAAQGVRRPGRRAPHLQHLRRAPDRPRGQGRARSRRSARRRLSSRITPRAVVSGTSETIEISRSRRRPPSSVIAQRQTASSRSSQRVR